MLPLLVSFKSHGHEERTGGALLLIREWGWHCHSLLWVVKVPWPLWYIVGCQVSGVVGWQVLTSVSVKCALLDSGGVIVVIVVGCRSEVQAGGRHQLVCLSCVLWVQF